MSRVFLLASLSLTIVCGLTMAAESSTEDGLKQGDPIGAFRVTKVAGAEDDGVEPGDDLCYRCRYGSRPMVMIFARDTGGKVTDLVQKLDVAVGENEESRLSGLLTFIGAEASELKTKATEFAKASGVKRVPVVVAKDAKTGPLAYQISDAAVTIVVAKDSQVIAAHAFDADSIDVAKVMQEVKQMLD